MLDQHGAPRASAHRAVTRHGRAPREHTGTRKGAGRIFVLGAGVREGGTGRGPTSRNAARDRIRIQSYRNTLPASIEFSVVLRRTLRRSRVERSVSTLLGQVTQASARAPTQRTPPRRFRATREHDLVLPAKVRTRGALTPRVRVNSSSSRQQSGKRDA